MAHSSTVEVLYHDHHGWLNAWLRRRLGCPDSAADLAQDTFIRVLGARQTSPIVEPRAFLTTIAKRLLCNHYRRQDLERAYLETLAQMPEMLAPSEEEKAIILQTLLELDQLLDGLPPQVKRAFLLAQVDGLKQAEIARELGISLATVKRHLHKAALRCYFAR
ncbi:MULTISPECIES: sigma-70 family RNA polymerase sigma factor [Pseudomonas]|uniref:RNA polymerase sigma factor n=1 Tax=Pseudomonas chlororaphis TaxID=587753 RepID=A0A0D5Y5G7_9PSED|nr:MULTISPECIES: sigma-70 family RNA polymerase sigma factor [Pseudomonas]AJO76686.1 RNA polymerase sigma factor [Pseudomonas sp. MRSN 12121]AKA26551.1 RNA polymerase sigma factor [Pseudomonas chlororaphis]